MKVKKYTKAMGNYLSDADYRFLINAGFGRYDNMPDREFIKRKFKSCIGRPLNLDNPQTFNEKLQWPKLYDRKPGYTVMVDKYRVRDYIKEKLGEEYLIPLLGVWNDPKDIDFEKLPNQFVLKCNHNSGLGMYICKDKSKLTTTSIRTIRRNLSRGLAQDYYLTGREWPYKDVPRKIIAEKYMEDPATSELRDYKWYCFDGEPKLVMINTDRAKGQTKADYFDMDFNHLDFTWGYPNAVPSPEKPKLFDEMKRLSRILSKGIPHIRVDFYEVQEQIYFGELTFFDGSGFDKFNPPKWDKKLGEWITLPEKKGTNKVIQ